MKFWQGKKVLITGHTGFKGSWLSLWLQSLGADIIGFSLAPDMKPNLFEMIRLNESMKSIIGDIRDFELIQTILKKYQPEIIIHLAAQPLVSYSYQAPLTTYTTNVIGTINLLEATRFTDSVKTIVNVTSDKCYENKELQQGYHENDSLGGDDPYSSSKACAELITRAYSRSYLKSKGVNLSTARAGNVIGGGDWGKDRLVPDIVSACVKQHTIELRYPHAVRPWQHVLEPLSGYLAIAKRLYLSPATYAEAWNFGPSEEQGFKTVAWLTDRVITLWGANINWIKSDQIHDHETTLLRLNSSKANSLLDWNGQWDIEITIKNTVNWYKAYLQGENMLQRTLDQINEFNKNEAQMTTKLK